MSSPENIEVQFDEDTLGILKKIHPSHRNTAVCFGIKLLQSHELFNTLFVMDEYKDPDDTSKVNQLETSTDIDKPTESSVSKPKTSWSDF